ncbi:MAG: GGDEF domain-containing protein [Burkholderiaceae bacterium]
MRDPASDLPRKQALRLRRFLYASLTYMVGSLMLAACSAVGLVSTQVVWISVVCFAAANAVFAALLLSGANLRFADPSLTLPQVLVGATTVMPVLTLGQGIHFLVLTYYSSLFVFAMLHLRTRELIVMELYVLVTYGIAFALRQINFHGQLDLRVEGIYAILVVISSLWYAMAAGTISRLRARLRESLSTIERLATSDALTGTHNRRHLDATLAAELQRRQRSGQGFCVCLIDIDRFKSINDRFGHPTGDAVLQGVAQCMKAQLRSLDVLGRWGGEEFMAILPGTAPAAARACAERLRASVQALRLLSGNDESITVSIGVAECRGGDSAEALLARADAALYRAKHGGRNRVEAAD